MCGRFSINLKARELEEIFDASFEEEAKFTRFNIAPSAMVPAILDEDRKLFQLVKWGILPKWMEKQGKTTGLINVRGETVMEKPTWKSDFEERRCIIPATSFFEWEKAEGKKIPYLIKMKDGKPFSFAGIWSVGVDEEGNLTPTFAILTTEANGLLRIIHDRMPVILDEKDIEGWLDHGTNIDDLMKMLRPYDADKMMMHRVSDVVNNPKNDKAEILNPL